MGALIWLLPVYMALMSRLSGNGFGKKWSVSWLPELLFSIPFGIALGWALLQFGHSYCISGIASILGTATSYAGMQSGTWLFLQWDEYDGGGVGRKSTIKPVVDKIALWFGFKFGSEGYSWVAASVKGFIIGLPVGGLINAILWPLGYEIGSHAKGRVKIDPHAVSEAVAGIGAGISILIFIKLVALLVI